MSTRFSLAIILLILCHVIAAGQSPQLIDVGGYHLDVVRAGSGTPPIILVGGLGNALDTWSQIVPSAAELSTVVAYSRAGLGRSEPGPSHHTAKDSVLELHALLAKLNLKPPYVLVGASYGGILVRLYTSLYPAEVGGLVLVDASHEQQVQRYGKLEPKYPAEFRAFFEEKLRTLKGAEADETRESVRIQNAGAVEELKPLPDIPLAVLTSMKADPAAAVHKPDTPGSRRVASDARRMVSPLTEWLAYRDRAQRSSHPETTSLSWSLKPSGLFWITCERQPVREIFAITGKRIRSLPCRDGGSVGLS